MKKHESPIILDYKFNTSIGKLWSAIVEIDQMKKWFFDNIPDFKPELGFMTKFAVQNEHRTFTHLWKITDVIPENKITYSWKYEEYPGDSLATFSLIQMDDHIKLNLTIEIIEDFPDDIPEFTTESCTEGWNYFIGQNLKAYLNKSKYCEQLNKIITNSVDKINAIGNQDFEYKASVSKWSKKEILGHLIDSAYNNHQRFLRANAQNNLVFQGYDQDEWVIKNNYQNRSRKDVLNTWITVNRHLGILIESLPNEVLTRQTQTHNFHKICMNLLKEKETSTLSYLIWDYLFHIEYHLNQIIPGYEKLTGKFEKYKGTN